MRQERFAKTHPEYFALKSDGTRCNTFTGAASSRHGHLCWSNPGLRDVFFNDCVERFAKGAQYVDVMANDAYPGCCCPNCRKLYNAEKYGAADYATDLMWDFTADLAKRLKAAGVKGKITQMAYSPYGRVPDFDIPDNVAVMVAVGGPWAWGDAKRMGADLDKIRAWSRKTGGAVWIWAYPHKYGATRIKGIPDVAPQAWGKYYKTVADMIFGSFAESETDNWIYHYLNYYVFSRVMWDGKNCDMDAILDEHHRLMFGAAAAEMKAFYGMLEDKWLHRMAGNVIVTEIGPVMTAPTEAMMWNDVYSDAVRAKMDELLAQAAAKVAPGSLEAKRIAFFRREYFDGFTEGIAAYHQKQATVKALRWNPGAGEKLTLNWYSGDKKNPERVKTTVAAAREGDDLVFTFDCEEPRMDDLAAVVRERDDENTWKDSGVELFLNPSGDRRHFLHLIVNAKGSLYDSSNFKPGRSSWGAKCDHAWNSNAKVGVTPRADGWTTVVRLPVASLGEMKPEFPVEFLRSRMPLSGKGQGYYKWSVVNPKALDDLECFGTMVVPSAAAPAAGDIVGKPDFAVRDIYTGPKVKYYGGAGNVPGYSWLRLRLQTEAIPCCHGSNRFRFLKRFGETHPEYFARRPDGSRCNRYDGVRPSTKDGFLCWSSPVVDELEKDVLSYFRGEDASVRGIPTDKPGRFAWGKNCLDRRYVDIMPNDAFVKCTCEKCQKAWTDDPNYASELIWGVTARVAQKLLDEGLPGTVTQMSYFPYSRIPDIDLPTNILVMTALGGPFSLADTTKSKESRTAHVRAWNEKLNRKTWIWTYPLKGENEAGVPQMCPRAWGRYYKELAPWIFGAFAESESDLWFFNHLNHYVFAKVCWNNATDVDALLDEYFRRMFGAAAPEMAKVYADMEETWMTRVVGKSVETPLGPVFRKPDPNELWTKVYSPERLASWKALVQKGAAEPEERRAALMEYAAAFKDVTHEMPWWVDSAAVIRERTRSGKPWTIDDAPRTVFVGEYEVECRDGVITIPAEFRRGLVSLSRQVAMMADIENGGLALLPLNIFRHEAEKAQGAAREAFARGVVCDVNEKGEIRLPELIKGALGGMRRLKMTGCVRYVLISGNDYADKKL